MQETDDGTGFVDDGNTIVIEADAAANVRKNAAFRFIDVDLPTNATIVSAILTLTASDDVDDNMSANIYGEDTDDSVDFISNPKISNRIKTDVSVSWAIDSAGTDPIDSPDLKAIIQEVKDRPGWADGNALTILMFGKDLGGNKKFKTLAFESLTGGEAQLYIKYTLAGDSFHYQKSGRPFWKI